MNESFTKQLLVPIGFYSAPPPPSHTMEVNGDQQQHSSKSLLLCSIEETHTCLEHLRPSK